MLAKGRFLKFLEKWCVRNYVKKPVRVDLSYIEDLPIHELPSKSSSEAMVYAWGLGEHGGLGHYMDKKKKMKGKMDPRFRQFNRPFRHIFGEQYKVKHIAAGFGFSAFVVSSNNDSQLYGTGLNTDSQIGYQQVKTNHPLEILFSPVPIKLGLKTPTKTKIVGVSAGRAHLVVATDLEGVFTLGNNAYGQCGRPIIENEKYSGSRIINRIPSIEDETVKSVECGQDHTFFLTESGRVYSCGWGADGQTGLGHYQVESRPKRVLGDIQGENIVKISSKSDCVLAINDKGDVFGWGNSEYSQLFGRTDSIQQVNRPVHLKKCQGFGKIIDVAAAGSYCLMLNELGDVFSWGYGILGRGPEVEQSWMPEIIPPILFGRNEFEPDSKVTGIFTGLNFSGAVSDTGQVYTWGKNKGGCLGLGHYKDQFFPLRVYIGGVVKRLALGVDHSFAMCNPF